MKKKNIHHFFLLTSLLFGLFVIGSNTAAADGAVSTKGQIELTKPSEPEPSQSESTLPSSTSQSSTEPSSTTVPSGVTPSTSPSGTGGSTYYSNGKWYTTPSDTGTYTKPEGRYPSTGELVKTSLSVSGAVLIGAAGLFYWWKRKKQAQERGEE